MSQVLCVAFYRSAGPFRIGHTAEAPGSIIEQAMISLDQHSRWPTV